MTPEILANELQEPELPDTLRTAWTESMRQFPKRGTPSLLDHRDSPLRPA